MVDLSPEDRRWFGLAPLVARHTLHHLDLFSDQSLIELLEGFPRENLFAFSMGSDPTRQQDNQSALHEGVSAVELLAAVKRGRLWLNITRVDTASRRYRNLIDQLYAELGAQCPDLGAEATQGTLLISSPGAMVYYHLDGPTTLLWHIRGEKRIWIYPALDERFAAREDLERIFAGVAHEYLPYQPEFDGEAVSCVLRPGDLASWPQNAPHRITNLNSINVSLSTEHFTQASRRRARIYKANHFLRGTLGLNPRSIDPGGPGALVKTAVHRAAAALHLGAKGAKRHIPSLRIEATAARGCVPLATSVEAEGRSP